jgi:hypothetical protein
MLEKKTIVIRALFEDEERVLGVFLPVGSKGRA